MEHRLSGELASPQALSRCIRQGQECRSQHDRVLDNEASHTGEEGEAVVGITKRRNPSLGSGDEEGKRGERHENQQKTPKSREFGLNRIHGDEKANRHNDHAETVGDRIGSVGPVPLSIGRFSSPSLFIEGGYSGAG